MASSRKTWLMWLAAPALAAGGVAWWQFGRSLPGGHSELPAPHPASTTREMPSPHNQPPIQTLILSEQARNNLDLQFRTISLIDYWRSLSVPAEVIEEPGHCLQRITTSIDGIVQKVHILKGQTVYPGDELFDMKLVDGPLANGQANLLKTVQNLELVNAELARIKPLADQGTIPIRTLLEKEYEQKRLEAQKHTDTEELLIRGLTEEQIQSILNTKTLLREFTIRVPYPVVEDDHKEKPESEKTSATTSGSVTPAGLSDYSTHEHGVVYTVEHIDVVMGELVRPGNPLCQLALHTMLLIEGRAFEREANLVERAMAERWPVEAHFETGDVQPMIRKGLTVLSIENSLDAVGRTLKFYIPLKNEVFLDREVAGGIFYRNWRFRPGQKVRLQLPIEYLKNRMVLPLDAVVREGANAFVFRVNGRLIERVPVVIDHQDVNNVVLGRGSRIYVGDLLALNQAYQLNLMLRQNESSHAPHEHDHDH